MARLIEAGGVVSLLDERDNVVTTFGKATPSVTPAGFVGIGTTTPLEQLSVASTPATTARISLGTYQDTDAAGSSELIRLYGLGSTDAKPSIAFYPEYTKTLSQVWVQTHLYLHFYMPTVFAAAQVNTGMSALTLSPAVTQPTGKQNSYPSKLAVTFTTTGVLPAGLSLATPYYLSAQGAGVYTIYSDVGLSSQVTITDGGTGTHTATPDNTTAGNLHQHFSIEVADATGAKQSRLSIPYGYTTTEIGIFSANFNVNSGILRVYNDAGSLKELQFGNTPTSNLTPDGTTIRWSMRQDTTAESGSNVGSDWRLVRFSDGGAAQDQPILVQRSTGFVGIGNVLNPGVALDVGKNTVTNSLRINGGSNASTFATLVFDRSGTDLWNLQLRNDSTNVIHLRDAVNGSTILAGSPGARASLSLLSGTPSFGSGTGVIFIANDTADPSGTPTGGGVLYVSAGALKWKGSSGTVTTLGVA